MAFFGWTKGGLHRWIVIKERQEDRYTFYDGGPQLGLDAAPVVIEPALDCFELLAFACKTGRGCGNIAPGLGDDGIRNVILIEMAQQFNRDCGLQFIRCWVPVKPELHEFTLPPDVFGIGYQHVLLSLEKPFTVFDLHFQFVGVDGAFIDIEKRHVIVVDFVQ